MIGWVLDLVPLVTAFIYFGRDSERDEGTLVPIGRDIRHAR